MSKKNPQYISASRRTDLPRFQPEEFFKARRKGCVVYAGPYGGNFTVSLKPDDVAGYIFWSKDFKKFITHPDFKTLISQNNAVFQFTINECPELEPGVPPLQSRIQTLRRLADMVGPERIIWRCDPFCKYVSSQGKIITNEAGFYTVLPLVVKTGISRCIFSFMSLYQKTKNRPVKFVAFSEQEKQRICKSISTAAQEFSIVLTNCCNPEVLTYGLPIKQAHCVDNDLLAVTDRFGVHKTLKLKPSREACGCYASRDIGSYNPVCRHGCYYCYANPKI